MALDAASLEKGEANELETLGHIFRSAIWHLEKENRRAYDLLADLAEKGDLGRHLTSRSLDNIAEQLLDTLEGKKNAN